MTAKVRAWSSVLGCVALVAALAQATGADELPGVAVPASAVMSAAVLSAPTPSATGGPAQNETFTKYYAVTAGQDGPETLAAIAGRLLGTASRAEEIYRLNVGRQQPDGQTLTESRQLRAGWSLILPWDAVGDGVRVGQVPTGAPAGGTSPGTPPPPPPAPPRNTPTSGPCANPLPPRANAGWAQERMTPDQAWGRTRGSGVLVAVVDSGVDAATVELGGRVAVGADIPAGSGRGDIDCLGSGTAMASIIGARTPGTGAPSATRGTPVVGMAPEATILPLRVVGETPQSKSADAATAIQVAVSAGARVIALGAFVNVSDADVSEAIRQASQHDVVLVAPALAAATDGSTSPSAPSGPDSLLRVGGFGAEGQPAASYQPAGVDVAAPGIDVGSIGANGAGMRTGSGSQYAVAFVAGAAALVRSAHPDLNAAQVVKRIKATADHAGRTDPDPVTGWGMVNANAAVTTALAAEVKPAPRDSGGTPTGRILSIGLLVVAGLAGAALLFRRPSGALAATGDGVAARVRRPGPGEVPGGPVGSPIENPDGVRGVFRVDGLPVPGFAGPAPVDDGVTHLEVSAGGEAQTGATAPGTSGSTSTGSAARG
ncbi:S8 family serine peptidase [Micromonospora chokoriensis]|uniref:S8 family serine peptidase n=1 Tax=Micromonospora chokoriensis TaxID=356851 RepID=UPI00068953A8|nr:S8 family serine peptidase [Micromonospora chokoriensis]